MADWIGRIVVAPEVEDKLRTKHNLTGDMVREAVTLGAARRAVIEVHPAYGERLIAFGYTYDGVHLVVYLRPLDRSDGLWECLTAYRMRT